MLIACCALEGRTGHDAAYTLLAELYRQQARKLKIENDKAEKQ